MNLGIVAAIAYGLLAFVGGVMGYQKVQSKVSLISGGISGLLLICSGIFAWQGLNWGLQLAGLIAGTLVIVFGIRLMKTQKLMPAGLMLLTGLMTLGIIGYQLYLI